ncbi:RE1-silencing transcription factor B-like isoform X2 [Euwallacea fornicatus]|uniref:RE1-silencing transcription factor B-like isoform X2 n=1 Tax=Euwallacea fornicatus TaxID=995702 RepID=UPI00338DFA12
MSSRRSLHSGVPDYCRLCLGEIQAGTDSSVLLHGIVKEMLHLILSELNLSICESPMICKSCFETLKQCYSFKSSCLEAEDKIQEFVCPQIPVLVNLKEVLLKTTNATREASEQHEVCRTCLTLGLKSSYTKLCSYEGDPLQNMVEKCLPEIGLNVTKDSSICATCLEQLEEQFHFIMQCLDTEAKINYYSEKKFLFKNINLYNVCSFTVSIEESEDVRDMEALENDSCDRLSLQKSSNIQKTGIIDLTDDYLRNIEKNKSDPYKELFKVDKSHCHDSMIIEASNMQVDSDSEVSVTDERDLLEIRKIIKTRTPKPLEAQIIAKEKLCNKEENDGELSEDEFPKKRLILRKCKICKFKTKFGSRMKAHMTRVHSMKTPLEEPQKDEDKVYHCRQLKCLFKTVNREDLKLHKQVHKKEKEQKCPHCGIVFVKLHFYKRHLENHSNYHTKDPSQKHITTPILNMNMNKLSATVNKFSFNGQFLKMFKCRLCPYQTRLKSNYEKHSMSHKKGTEIVTHKCNVCNFETIHRENFLSHMQGHENDESNKVLKCFLCSFQPKSKFALKQHVNQVHKGGTGL